MVAAACAVIILAVVLVSARSPDTSVEPTVQAFLLAWEQGNYKEAAALTTGDPARVTAELRTAYQQLDAADLTLSMGTITQHGNAGQAHFYASIDLGRSGAPWQYEGSFALSRINSAWKVRWRPSVINPGLRPGYRLAVVTTMPQRAALLDAAGRPLARRSLVFVAGVRPGRLAHPERTADRLANATHLAANEVYGDIAAAPSKHFFELLRLSPSKYQHLRRKLSRVPGLIIKRARMRLFDTTASSVAGTVGTETARVLRADGVPYRPGATVGLSGLEAAFQHSLVGTPTTEVVAENAAGRQMSVLRRWPGHAGEPGGHRGGPCIGRQDSRRGHAQSARHARGQRAERPLLARSGVHHRLRDGAGLGRLQCCDPDTVHGPEPGRRSHLHQRPAGVGTWPAAIAAH
jgi:hypothetical protein